MEFIIQKKTADNHYLLINLIFAFFPVSFVIGSLFVNLNLLLLCIFGVYYLKSKILSDKFDFNIKIIFLFFVIIIFSTSLDLLKNIFFDGYSSINEVPSCFSTNCYSPLEKLTKSILFFRFFLLLLIIYLLNKYSILNFKYFFLTGSLVAFIISLDVSFQYAFGFNTIGLKSGGYVNSSYFADEYIAGGFIQRFAFFAIPFAILISKDKKYGKFIFATITICVVGAGILFAGNKMPTVLFIFGLLLLLLLTPNIKRIFLIGVVSLLLLFSFIVSINGKYKIYLENTYFSFLGQVNTLRNITGEQKWKKTRRVEEGKTVQSKTSYYVAKHEGHHRRIFLTAIDTWKTGSITEKIFGSGIKSFRENCWKLEGQPDINLSEDLYPDKKNRLCSNHPHNYYLEILTDIGIFGMLIVLIIACSFLIFTFKNFKLNKKINLENLILTSAIISLILELIPLRSTGSLFTTNNAAYIILIAAILLCHKTIIKNNNVV